jgi:hypothetical protein
MSALRHFRTKCVAAKIAFFDHLVGGGEQRRVTVMPSVLPLLRLMGQSELARRRARTHKSQ